jgi:3'-5' exoribonuclease
MLNEKIPAVEKRTGEVFPRETLLRLKHMILSHHGSYEFGSPKLPMTQEAIALHHLDNLDAKINEFMSLIESDPNSQSSWTPFSTSMQRKLYKGGA